MNPRMWIARAAGLFRKDHLEEEMASDIQEHLEMAIEENLRRGMSPVEAEAAARRSFGGIEQVKELVRDQGGIPVLETLWRETRFALRSLQRSPGFTFVASLTLALAIGANSAIFGAVNALLFHPGGISQPERIVVVRSNYDRVNVQNITISFSDFNDVRTSAETFLSAAIAKSENFSFSGGAYPQHLAALRVSSQWFELLGIQPQRGRFFTADEDRPDNNQVVVLSHAAWQRVFGGDPSVLGKTIDLDQRPYKVVGVLPPEYAPTVNELGGMSGVTHDVFVPLGVGEPKGRNRYNETFLGIAKLQPGITMPGAYSFINLLTKRGLQLPGIGAPRVDNGWRLSIVPYTDFVGGEMKTPLFILWGAVAFVLLIASSNIAGLMLARTTARSREFAVRKALGGTRWHLRRQVLTESLLLASAGSLLGLVVAYAIVQAVQLWGPQNLTGGLSIPFDPRMLAFTAVVGLFSGILFGLAAARQAGRENTIEGLKEGSRSGAAGTERARMRTVLVTGEVALALVLSIGAGLLLRSLSQLQRVDVGFRPDGLMTASVTLPPARYKEPARQVAFYRGALQRLAAIPGVQSSAAAYPMPFSFGYEGRPFQIEGRPVRASDSALVSQFRAVTPQFFSTLGIPLKRGRVFNESDDANGERVAIIDELLAQKYWSNEDPLGKQIVESGVKSTVVGIVGHTKQSDLAAASDLGVFYYPFYQTPIPLASLVVRNVGNLAGGSTSLQDAVNAVDPVQAMYDTKTMNELIAATLSGRRFTVVLLGLFALTAVFLAVLGLYGVINYGVTQRTQEIGIRMALGAQKNQILHLILGNGLRLAGIGLLAGELIAFGIARFLSSQLFGVNAFDIFTFGGMALLLAAVALLASYLPARRAVQLDPLEACRYE